MAEFSLYCIFGEKIGEKTNQGLRDLEQENKEKQGKTREKKKKKTGIASTLSMLYRFE